MTKDIPILYSGPMVRAQIEGRKIMTRRILKPPTPYAIGDDIAIQIAAGEIKPRFAVGDRLWVRENIWQASPYPGTLPSGEPDERYRWSSRLVHYAADGDPPNTPNRHHPEGFRPGSKLFSAPDPYAIWLQRPSIHMPRWASRLTNIITAVKIERLQDISDADAIAEGIPTHVAEHTFRKVYRDETERAAARVACFRDLWKKLNGPASWEANPFVVAISYRVIKANIDTPAARCAA